jgi:hypothetical protein
MANRRRTRDVLGVPFVPPTWATRSTLAIRRRLAAAHRQTAPPSIRVLEGLFGVFDNRVLGLLVELEIPELLQRPRDVAQLAEATGTDRDRLDRLLRYAAARGFVAAERRGRYRSTPVTEILRRDHPNSWRGWVEFAGSDWFWDAFRHLDAAVKGTESAVHAGTGHDFFEFVNNVRPEAGDAFNRAMAAGAMVQAFALNQALDWSNVRTVCDVGGGTGAALEYVLTARPHLEGILFDLPEVVSAACSTLRTDPLVGRCQIRGGSFFDAVPEGADRYLLLAIVHDWDDTRATEILSRVREAMDSDARVVVVEGALSDRPRDEFAQASDLLMCALADGRERTLREFETLFERSRLTLVRTIPLMTGFTAFEAAAR